MNVAALVLFAVWFVVVFVVRSVVQKRQTGDSGIRPGAFADDASAIERVAYLLLVVAFVGAIAAPVAAMAGLDPLTGNDAVPNVGLVVAVAGIGATYVAQLGMGSDWRVGIDRTEVTGLVTGGLFAHSRNPMYLAVLAILAGLAMASRSPILGVYLLGTAVAFHLRVVRHDEPRAEASLPDVWAGYRQRVPRWLPRLPGGLTRRR